MSKIIYLDNNATTPLDSRVFEAMKPYFFDKIGNPSSAHHRYGWEAKEAVETARKTCADLLNCNADNLIFTSGSTESINTILIGVARTAIKKGKKHIVSTTAEHSAVLDTLKFLQSEGFDIELLEVDQFGRLDPERLIKALRQDTALVSVIWANNEIGSINPIHEISEICREIKILFHTDAAQAVGKISIDLEKTHVDFLSASAHKFYGPKGIGILYKKDSICPLMHGGGQEKGIRPGTLNVPSIVGMSTALKISVEEMPAETTRLKKLSKHLFESLKSLGGMHLNGHPELRIPGNLNISFDFIEAEALLISMPDLAMSTGAACASSKKSNSHVLKAIGLDSGRIKSSIRIGIGRTNTKAEIEDAVKRIIEEVRRLRKLSPDYSAPC